MQQGITSTFPGSSLPALNVTQSSYYRARYYDPQGGRFLSEDPIEFEGGLNFYAYVENNPHNFFDPWGLKLCKVNLPGLGPAYLDDKFYPRVKQWIDSNVADGIKVDFTQAFRTTEKQASLANDPSAITPAPPGTSLHEAGFAVDVAWSRIPPQLRPIVVANAQAAGLTWGGNFKHPRPDPVHFQRDPGSRKVRIQQAQKDYKDGGACDCK